MGKLLDSMREYLNTTPKEQLEKDWEEMKHLNELGPDILDVINPKSLTLTPHEIETIISSLQDTIRILKDTQKFYSNTVLYKETFDRYNNLLTKLKAYQDEHNFTRNL